MAQTTEKEENSNKSCVNMVHNGREPLLLTFTGFISQNAFRFTKYRSLPTTVCHALRALINHNKIESYKK